MDTPQVAIDLIMQEESGGKLYLEPYQDVAGVWTIGHGHTSGVGPDYPPISEEEALELLRKDVAWAETAVRRLVEVEVGPWEFGALVSLVFNIGETRFAGSTLLRLLNAGDGEGAAREFRKWRRSGGEIQPGLLSRRGREEQLFRMGSGQL